MKKLIFLMAFLSACSVPGTKKEQPVTSGFIGEQVIKSATDSIRLLFPDADQASIIKGVKHAASLWRQDDGSTEEFIRFAKENYIGDTAIRKKTFFRLSNYFEALG